MTAEQIAAAHQKRRKALAKRAADEVARLWARIDRTDIARSWAASVPAAFTVVGSAQAIAAASASTYLGDLAEAYDVPDDADSRVRVDRFSGIASDGRDLSTLLYEPAIASLTVLKRGSATDADSRAQLLRTALASGRFALDMITRTQIADAGRTADHVALVAQTRMTGYVRVLSPPSCSRCVVLAGRFYRWNAGFQRHPRCLPAGVAVSGPATLAATRRWFQGELVVITTASGQQLPITGNHPVLTDRGWIPAHLIEEGDQVVRSTRGKGAAALVVPDEDQVPSRVEDLWRPDRMMTLDHVPTTTEDFHGDGGHGEVDVVLADRLLRYGFDTPLGEFAEQEQLSWGIAQAFALAQLGAAQQQIRGLLSASYRMVRRGGLGSALVGSLTPGSDPASCGHASDLNSGRFQMATHNGAGNPESAAQAVLAFTSAVRRSEVVGREFMLTPRWDPPAGPLSVETRAAYAGRGLDLLGRLAGQVELDRVVQVRRVEWSGHVYNLTSVEGWYSANGLIVSNCDCTHQPVVSASAADDNLTKPRAYFDSLDPSEQDRAFTKADAEAIREGADIGKVVNARRGMYTADGKLYTREAAGRRPRIMPEQIFRDARDRDDAIRLLRLHGYIT